MRQMGDQTGASEVSAIVSERLAAFDRRFHRRLADVSAQSPALYDLAESFPALLFALATSYGASAARELAIRVVVDGGSLKAAADALDLPMWTRHIPPQALVRPLPVLSVDGTFAAMLANRVPNTPDVCATWLERLAAALLLVGRDFAYWLAREPRGLPPAMSDENYQWLLAWGWASVHGSGDMLLRRRWSPSLGWKRAHDEITVWKKRVGLVGALGAPSDPWFENGGALGFEFTRLDSAAAWVAESVAMDNCLDQYASHISYGRVRVFSVRRAGRPVADIEITLRHDDATMPCISQIRGPRNRRAGPLVWQAAHAWLGSQVFHPLYATEASADAARLALAEFWAPYIAAVKRAKLPVRQLPMRAAHRLPNRRAQQTAGKTRVPAAGV
jgi:hypothetical protein